MQYELCEGVRYQATYYDVSNMQCAYGLCDWDDGATIPQFRYSENGTPTWTFYYTNGEQCIGGDSEFNIVWECDPLAEPFSLNTTCSTLDFDGCVHEMRVKSASACTIPPTQQCRWNDFDLSSTMGYGITCTADNNDFSYEYTPCMDGARCNGDNYQAIFWNKEERQCQYYLSQWDYGETVPKYFNNDGVDIYQFDYKNGEETDTCQDGIEMDIRWMCNFSCNPFCLNAECSQIDECKHQMIVQSVLACSNQTEISTKTKRDISKTLSMEKTMSMEKRASKGSKIDFLT